MQRSSPLSAWQFTVFARSYYGISSFTELRHISLMDNIKRASRDTRNGDPPALPKAAGAGRLG